MIDPLASDRIAARARVRASEIILLDAARAHVRTACEIGDAKTRRKALAKVSRDLARAWSDAECKQGAQALEDALDRHLYRGTPLADLARAVR